MKKYLYILIFVLIPFLSFSQSNIYMDYGDWEYIFTDTTDMVKLNAYVTKEIYELKGGNSFKFEFILKSKSRYENKLTKTWLYGCKVIVNSEEVTQEQFPNGFMIVIDTDDTIIYTLYTNDEDVDFIVEWDDAIYDPRN